MERLADSQPVMPENLTTAEMLARLAMFDQAQRRDLAWEWMAERDPEETVREILRAAASMSPRMRWLAADLAEEGASVDDRLAAIRSSGHPAAAEVAGAVADLTAFWSPADH